MKLLQHLYFRIYQLMVATGNRDIGSFASTLFMTMLFGVNILTLIEILDMLGFGMPIGIVVMTCIFISLYFLLVYNGKSAAIINLYAGNPTAIK